MKSDARRFEAVCLKESIASIDRQGQVEMVELC